jgi:hypothetical protein
MLFVSTNILKISEFKELFKSLNPDITFLDLSKIPLCALADESTSIVNHHSKCSVFLGYLEPGWMLDLPSQTILRKLFRKFSVGLVCNFTESLPFSWKNEIDTLYIQKPLNSYGQANSLNNGSSLHDQSQV